MGAHIEGLPLRLPSQGETSSPTFSRRKFLLSTAAIGAGVVGGSKLTNEGEKINDQINQIKTDPKYHGSPAIEDSANKRIADLEDERDGKQRIGNALITLTTVGSVIFALRNEWKKIDNR